MHGVEQFFLERARCQRRVSILTIVLGALLLGLVSLPTLPVFRGVRDLPIMRFGFAGPTRYVQLVQIDVDPGRNEPLLEIGPVRSMPGAAGSSGAITPAPT